MELNASLRGIGEPDASDLLVKLDIPSAGILSLDLATPGSATALPKLAVADLACGTPGPIVLERSASHLIIAVESPGPSFFRVASQDPSQPLERFRLDSGFSPDADAVLPIDKSGEDQEVIEIDANPLVYTAPAENRSLQARLDELCRRGEADDHGDSFTCATFLVPGRRIMGEIGNGWGDDADVFRFVLGGAGATKLWTLEIESVGSTDTFGDLYDQSGTLLEKKDGGGNGDNFRIVRVLPSGVYYVRVEGSHGAQGLYGLGVHASSW